MPTQVMRPVSHESWISILLRHIDDWRRVNQWSRETVVDHIVQAYLALYGVDGLNGVVFDISHPDAFTRMKNNADRFYRWVDEITKDKNLLCANFVAPVLRAMPAERAQRCADDLLHCCGLATRQLMGDTPDLNPIQRLQQCVKEGGEAFSALAQLADGATLDELEHAKRELTDLVEVAQQTRSAIELALQRMRAGK